MIRSHVLAALMVLGMAHAQESLPAFARVSGLPHAVALRRIPAEDNWDLVIALASAQTCEQAPRPCWWSTKYRLGILLQDRDDPGKLLPLAIEPGPNDDCSTRVERFTLQELVLSCSGEKWTRYDNQKFVYDVHARKLVRDFSYAPFSTERVLPGPKFVMAAGERRLVVEIDSKTGDPRVTSASASDPTQESEFTFGRFRLSHLKSRYGEEYPVILGDGKVYPLAQSDSQTWQRARPDEANSHLQVDPAERNEQIGPHQMEGGRFWFGKTFYNSEGLTGVGGFGYFDTTTASYHLFAPPQIAAWSVSAILVEPDCIWLALYRRGEYGNYPGGLLRWDHLTSSVHHWDMPWIATGMARSGDAIYMGTTDGLAVLRGDRIAGYFVDRDTGGHYAISPREYTR
jgi:hypothetical protein